MRKINYNFLFVIGLMLTLGLSSAFAYGGDDSVKRPKNTGILSVKTSPVSYPVKVDGIYKGMSGTGDSSEFYLEPGTHKIEIEFPNGKIYAKDVEVIKDRKNCICLKYIEETIKRPCPYDVSVSAPENVLEGDLITFAAFNNVSGSTTPLNYRWTVSPDTMKITSGLGTSAITVDTTGMGGQTITADLDVTDDVYGKTCFQKNSVKTPITKKVVPQAVKCDEFDAGPFDDTKARIDNCVIRLNSISPDAQLYVIIYQGTDKISLTRNTYDNLSKRTLDYLVKTRGVDPRQISIVKWGNHPRTGYEIWIVPPGAQPPVPQ